MSIKDCDRAAQARYKKKCKRISFRLYGTDADIKQHLENMNASGEYSATYIKRLIREDIEKSKG